MTNTTKNKSAGILSMFKDPKLQKLDQTKVIHDENRELNMAQLDFDIKYKKELIAQKERDREEKRISEDKKREHELNLANRQENHDFNILDEKHRYEDKIRKEDSENALQTERERGMNERNLVSHEAETRIREKRLTENYLESESDRRKFENQAKARDDAMLEVIKIMAKGAEDRKTLGIQAKLAQQGVDKEKIKGWIENIEEDNDK